MYEFFRLLVCAFFHIKYRITLIGRENLPARRGGYIIACNHQSYADPPMLAAVVHGKFTFMAKSELFEKNKLFAWIIRRCGAYPVYRGTNDTGALDTAVESLRKNRVFVIFPEGTRSKDGTLGRARSGIAVIASKAAAPVLPVCIYYGEKRRVVISVGKLIPAESLVIECDDRHALRRVSSLIMDNIKEQQDIIYSQLPDSEKVAREQAAAAARAEKTAKASTDSNGEKAADINGAENARDNSTLSDTAENGENK